MSSKRENMNALRNSVLLDISHKEHADEISFPELEDTPLLQACKIGNLNIVKQLVQTGTDVNRTGNTSAALSWSAQSGHVDVVECLLELGVDPNLPDGDGATPLQHAAERGHLEVVRCLAERGALADAAAGCGPSALSRAARAGHLGAAQLLVEAGARVDGGGGGARGRTPLREAVDARRGRVLKYLLGQGADADARDEDGVTALHTLIQGQRWAEARLLITHGAQLRSGGPGDNHALSALIGARQWDMAECLVARGATIKDLSTEEKTAFLYQVTGHVLNENVDLHNAFYRIIKLGNVDMLQMFIEKLHLTNLAETVCLYTILSKSYEEIKVVNVPLCRDIERAVESMLIQSRLFSLQGQEFSLQQTKECIVTVSELTEELIEKYFGKGGMEEDCVFVQTIIFIIQNIHVLKKQLQSTYTLLPWEEIEFYLINFVQSNINSEDVDEICGLFVDKDALLTHLRLFARKISPLVCSLQMTDIKRKVSLLRRSDIVQNILRDVPEFRNLYNDYEIIKNIYSLNRIECYVKLAINVDLSQEYELGKLVVQRALQVIGECLKNTSESPNVSEEVHNMLLHSAPRHTKEIITSLRDSLSHADTLTRKIHFEEERDLKFFENVQNDLKKITVENLHILFKIKIEALVTFFRNVRNCRTSINLTMLQRLFRKVSEDNTLLDLRSKEVEHVEQLINRINDTIKNKTVEQEALLKEIQILNDKEMLKLQNMKQWYTKSAEMVLNYVHMSADDEIITSAVVSLLQGFLKNGTQWLEMSTLINKLDESILNDMFFDIHTAIYELQVVLTHGFSKINAIDEIKKKLKKNESQSTKRYIQTVFTCIENVLQTENEKSNFKEEIAKNVRIYEAKQKLINLLQTKIRQDGTNTLRECDYAFLVNELNQKNKCKDSILKFYNKGNYKNCLFFIQKVDDRYATLLKTLDDVSFFTTDKYVQAFQRYFSGSKCLVNVGAILKIIQQNQEQNILRYFNQKLVTLKKIIDDDTERKETQVALEMLILDITEILEHSSLLADNKMFLLGHSPVLVGKSLRNYLAHGDPLVDLLPFNTSRAIATHAQMLLENGQELIMRRDLLVGNACAVDVSETRERHTHHLSLLATQTELFSAAARGDLEAVKDSIEKGADPKAMNMAGLIASDIAVARNRVEVFKFLVNTNLSIDIKKVTIKAVVSGSIDIIDYISREYFLPIDGKYFEDQTLMRLACFVGGDHEPEHVLKSDADLNLTLDRPNRTPLNIALLNTSHRELVGLLLREKSILYTRCDSAFSLVSRDSCRGTSQMVRLLSVLNSEVQARAPLIARYFEYLDAVESLLKPADITLPEVLREWLSFLLMAMKHYILAMGMIQEGAYVDVRDWTLLHYAASHGEISVLRSLLDRVEDVNTRDRFSCTLLHSASREGRLDAVRTLLERGAEVDVPCERLAKTALHCAAETGRDRVVQELLRHGANPDAKCASGWTALHFACANAHRGVVDALLSHGVEIDSRCQILRTPLLLATHDNNREIAEVLLERGAEVNVSDRNGVKPLDLAVFHGFPDMVRLLVAKGADTDARGAGGMSPLHCAALKGHVDALKELLSHGLDANVRIDAETTPFHLSSPLHLAAMHGTREAVAALKNAGADVNALNCTNSTPLFVAAVYGHARAVELLVSETNVNVVQNSMMTALTAALNRGYSDVVAILLANGADVNLSFSPYYSSPLHTAAGDGLLDLVEALLAHGADVNRRDATGFLPLGHAACNGRKDVVLALLEHGADLNASDCGGLKALHWAASGDAAEIVDILVRRGGDVNARDACGSTPLHKAAVFQRCRVARLLLAHGAEVDARSDDGLTAIHYAVMGDGVQVLAELIDAGADVNATAHSAPAGRATTPGGPPKRAFGSGSVSLFQMTPLHQAALSGNGAAVAVLVARGARTDVLDETGNTAFTWAFVSDACGVAVQWLLSKREGISSRGFDGTTVLQAAAFDGDQGVVSVLLQEGADAHARNDDSRTALHFAACGGARGVVSLLLGAGCDVDARDKDRWRPLHFAAFLGHSDAVSLLLDHGAAVDARNDDGDTPLLLACLNAHRDVARTLLDRGADADASGEDMLTPLLVSVEMGHKDLLVDLLQSGADVHTRDRTGATALHVACWNCDVEITRTLLEHEANPRTRDGRGKRPIDVALFKKNDSEDDANLDQLLSVLMGASE